ACFRSSYLLECVIKLERYGSKKMWFKVYDFSGMDKDWWWGNLSFAGNPNFILPSKLKSLKLVLKNWNVLLLSLVLQKQDLFYLIAKVNDLENHRGAGEDEKKAIEKVRVSECN